WSSDVCSSDLTIFLAPDWPRRDREPWKNTNGKKLRVEDMKNNHETKHREPSAAPEEQRRRQQVEQERGITGHVGSPFRMRKSIDQRRMNFVPKPRAHGFAMQPVRSSFRDPGKKIDETHLDPQQPDRPDWRGLSTEFRP